MEQGQNSGAQDTIDSTMAETENSLMAEMERLIITPATATEEAPACLISWVSEDPAQYNYKPDKVRIGPLHLDPDHWMEEVKKKLLHGLLPDDQPWRQQELRRYLTAMGGLECRARGCYNRTFSWLTSVKFALMLLLDGYFLYSHFVATTVESTDITVVRDVVFLLENQIPFFVLEEIHKLITDGADGDNSASVVVSRVARHVETLVQRHDYSLFTLQDAARARPCHLLHLLYMYFRPTVFDEARDVQLIAHNNPADNGNATSGSGPTPLTPARWRAATDYYVAGVKLVKRELNGGEVRSILDVELTGGTLHVPCLMVDGNTLRMLSNMVALEQYNLLLEQPNRLLGSHVTAYCLFMSQMANTEKDVALLVTKGIIVHFLHNDDDVATGLAKLCDGVILNVRDPKLNYLRPKQDALEELCRDGWRKSMAWLRHNKCNNYLMVLTVVAAIILFICTVEQSVFAALSYAKGKIN